MKNIIAAFTGLLACYCQAQGPAWHTVHFASGSGVLSEENKNALKSALLTLDKPFPCLHMSLTGHTDSQGSDEANQALSKKRAEAVQQFFTEIGFPSASVSTSFKGENAPRATNETENGMQANRRVEIRMTAAGNDCNPLSIEHKPQTITVAAEKGTDYRHETGTTIRIPANAFVDANGNPVTGEVNIQYSEWHTPADFILSGITMDYPHQGSETKFSSAGMFEIKAFQNENELKLAPGKTISMDFAASEMDPEVGFYRFNEQTNTWSQLQPSLTGNTPPAKLSRELTFATYKNALDYSTRLFPNILENPKLTPGKWLSLDERFQLAEYCGLDYLPGLSEEKKKENYCIRLVPVNKNKKSSHTDFRITAKYSKFPELKHLANTTFSISRNSASTQRMREMMAASFCDIRLVASGKRWVITLKGPLGNTTIDAAGPNVTMQPTAGNNYSFKGKGSVRQTPIDVYNNALKIRKENFEIYARQVFTSDFWLGSMLLMEQAETEMENEDWRNYFLSNYSEMKTRYENEQKKHCRTVAEFNARFGTGLADKFPAAKNWFDLQDSIYSASFRLQGQVSELSASLQLTGTGIYNCDKLYNTPDRIAVKPGYKDEAGNKLYVLKIYLIEKGKNGAILSDAEQLTLSQSQDYDVLALALDGRKFFMDSGDFPEGKLKNGDTPVFVLRDISEEVNSPETLNQLLASE